MQLVLDISVLPELLDGFDPDRFAQLLADDATVERTQQDLAEAQSYGVSGFPALLFRDSEKLAVVTRGFVPWDQLEPALTSWLEERYGNLTEGLFCDPETGFC